MNSDRKPLTMSAEREAEIRGCWSSDPFAVELDAERAAHATTLVIARELAEALEKSKIAMSLSGCMNGRRYVSLGIEVNNALAKARAQGILPAKEEG